MTATWSARDEAARRYQTPRLNPLLAAMAYDGLREKAAEVAAFCAGWDAAIAYQIARDIDIVWRQSAHANRVVIAAAIRAQLPQPETETER
jgi:hypothetical protein